MYLRKIISKDKDLLFEWRNLEKIVALSCSQRKISYAEHTKWFSSVCDRDKIHAFIIENEAHIPVGHLRFDQINNEECKITVYLDPSSTGRGIGVKALVEGCYIAFQNLNYLKIYADVRRENIFAQSAFKKAGFIDIEAKQVEAKNNWCGTLVVKGTK